MARDGPACPRSQEAEAVREPLGHLLRSEHPNPGIYAEITTGTPSPVDAIDKESLATFSAARIADIPESDPAKLALLMAEGTDRLHSYAPLFGLMLNPATSAGLSASFGIEIAGGEPFVIRFTDGRYSLEPGGPDPVDAVVPADPVAFLLVGTGRLGRSAAVALGLLKCGGNRPDLAFRFTDLFLSP